VSSNLTELRQKKNGIVQKKLKIIFWQGRKNQLIFGFLTKKACAPIFFIKSSGSNPNICPTPQLKAETDAAAPQKRRR
jgi:hypothetical protein